MSQLDPISESNELSGSDHGNGSNGALATIESHLPAVPSLGWPYGPPQRPEILTSKPNPLELFHAVRRRMPLAIGLGLLMGGLAAGLVWFFVPVKYEAFALLRVAEKPGQVLAKQGEAGTAFEIFKRTQVQLILSGMVLRRTVGEQEISKLSMIKAHDDDPVSYLKDQMILDYPDNSEILRVAIKGQKKDELVKIVDMVVKKYLTEVVQHERDQRLEQENKLEKRYGEYFADFTKQSNNLHTMEQVAKTSSTEAAQVRKRLAEDRLIDAFATYHGIQRQIYETDMNLAMIEASEKQPDSSRIPEVMVEAELKRDPTVVEMQKRLGEYKTVLGRHMIVATDPSKSPMIKSINQGISQLEQQLDEYKASMRPQVVEMLATQDTIANDPVLRMMTAPMLESKKAHLKEKLDEAKKDIDDHAKEFENLQSFSAEVAAKQEELGALKAITARLRSELDSARVERMAQERITQVDAASLASPSGDVVRKYVAVVFAGLLGFGLVVTGIAFVEFQSRRLNTSQQVNDGLGIKVVGELPSLSGRAWRRIRGGKGNAVLKALMAERIDGARTALIHTTAIDPPRVVMVTSANPSEGKTTTASQLAVSLARSGRRTLLIDADIRNPGAHRVFDMPLEPGLSELLRGEAERDAVVHPTRTANLWLLPGGRCDLRSVQALSSSYLGTTIAALCVQFDYVVIDSGPILKVADSLLVGQHVDAAIISVLKDVSKVPSVYEACDRLRSVGITVLGAVVNGVNDDVARHGIELLMSETT